MKTCSRIFLASIFIICLSLAFFPDLGLYADEPSTTKEDGSSGMMPVYYPFSDGEEDSASVTIQIGQSEEQAASQEAVYSQVQGGFVFEENGQTIVLSLQEAFGQGAYDLVSYLGIEDGDQVFLNSIDLEGESLYLVTKYKDGTSMKEWEYDPLSHLIVYFHTEGRAAGEVDYVEQEKGGWFRWADDNSLDPEHADQIEHSGWHGSEGRQYAEHFLASKYFYDTLGDLIRIEYYTSTGGTGSESGNREVYGRYTYRVDTFGPNPDRVETTYYNDPYPNKWDPDIQGVVTQDHFGRYFLLGQDGSKWLIISRQDGEDDGAGFLNDLTLSQLVEEQTPVRFIGHEYSNDTIYFDNQQVRILAVTKGEVSDPPVEPPAVEYTGVEVIADLLDPQTETDDLEQTDNGNDQALEVIVDHEDPQAQAVSWQWQRSNTDDFGWEIDLDSLDLSAEDLSGLVLRLIVSGEAGSEFSIVFEDGFSGQEEIVVSSGEYVSVRSDLQYIVIALDQAAAVNPDFDWSSLQALRFNPLSDSGDVIIQQLRIDDVSNLKEFGLAVGVFNDNEFGPIDDWYGLKPAMVLSYKDLFDIVDEDIAGQFGQLEDNGQIPYLTLEFWHMDVKSDEEKEAESEQFIERYGQALYDQLVQEAGDKTILGSISYGSYDQIIRDYARLIAGHDGEVLLRIFHEFNGHWYPWSLAESSEQEFIAAWERVYDIFQEEGASNARFVFSPYSLNSRGYDDVEMILAEIKDKVDIIALDGYGPNPENSESPLFNGIFTELMARLEGFNLPFIIGEFGSEFDKAEFHSTLDSELRAGAYPDLLAIIYFDIAKLERGVLRDFGVSTIADDMLDIQADNFYRVSPEDFLGSVDFFDQFDNLYWGGSLEEVSLDTTLDSGSPDERDVSAVVASDSLTLVIDFPTTDTIQYELDLIGGSLTADGQVFSPLLHRNQYLVQAQAMSEVLDEAFDGSSVANYVASIVYRLENPDFSPLLMPGLPANAETGPDGNVTIGFTTGILNAADLSDLWAEVKYDGKTEYWDFDPSMLSSDGASFSMQFSSEFDGKTVEMRLYGFDIGGRQTDFTNTITILVHSAPSAVTMPTLPSTAVTDGGGNLTLVFTSGTLDPADLNDLWAEVTYNGATEYWDFHPSMLSQDGTTFTMQFDPAFDGVTIAMRLYGFDTQGSQTDFTNQVLIDVAFTPSTSEMPVLPSSVTTEPDGSLRITFVSGTLMRSDLSDLWAEAEYDGMTEHWDLDPSLLSGDGTSLSFFFNSSFSGKEVRMRFYGFDLQGQQTDFTNQITIYVQ